MHNVQDMITSGHGHLTNCYNKALSALYEGILKCSIDELLMS